MSEAVAETKTAIASTEEKEDVTKQIGGDSGDAKKKKRRKKWFPLESNPAVMNKYLARLGFPSGEYEVVDVYSTEEWALAMVPTPALAVLMLFPIKEDTEQYRREEAARVKESGQEVSDKLFYMKQTVGNACGTVGLIHAAANASIFQGVKLKEGSFLERFMGETKGMTPDEMAVALEEDGELEKTHSAAADDGQSAQIPMEESVDTHFVCFTEADGCLYELDGRKEFPINHGPSSKETMLQDGCRVVKEFMDRDPEELRFTIVALVPAVAN